MEKRFKEDKSGKIDDGDELFGKLDSLLDDEEYDKAISEIMAIPREKQSNKLRFTLVCAYSDKGDDQKALEELDEMTPLCETSYDRARNCYLRGHIYYLNDKEIAARRLYKEAQKLDPEYTRSIKIEEDLADCDSLIAENLGEVHKTCAAVWLSIGARCSKNAEKRKLSAEEFRMRLGFFPAFRSLPGFERPMGLSGYLETLKGEEAEKARSRFENYYGVHDSEGFFELIQKSRECNISHMADDVMAFIIGRPRFAMKDLNDDGRFAFENSVIYVRKFAEFLPRGGIRAWDIGEKIGLARHAYRCGILGERDYLNVMARLEDEALRMFSGWEEYMCSLVFGAAVFAYSFDDWNIAGSVSYAENMVKMLLGSDLPDVSWNAKSNA